MKFDVTSKAGDVAISVLRKNLDACLPMLVATLAISCCEIVYAQSLYKYRGENGEWIYTDRKPGDDKRVEVRDLEFSFSPPVFSVSHDVHGRSVDIIAHNEFHAPIEMRLRLDEIKGVEPPNPDDELRWVIDPRSDMKVITLQVLENVARPFIKYSFQYVHGDPNARHQAANGYRAPFAVGSHFPITQAYPDAATHRTRSSLHAVDVAMPIGTDVVAARDGVVFDIAANNWRNGTDIVRDGDTANIVRILHDDGTMSLYAHLNLNSVRVKPGDRVNAGQYIADSGNTGFSTGPHLHFVVHKNVGLSIESVPVLFRGWGASEVVPATGNELTAYP